MTTNTDLRDLYTLLGDMVEDLSTALIDTDLSEQNRALAAGLTLKLCRDVAIVTDWVKATTSED